MLLKLFYSKAIDFGFFIHDKDTFLILVCYILFNENSFYNRLFTLFELLNKEETEKLIKKISNLGTLTPEEAGIKEEFCLNEKSKNSKENKINLKKEKHKENRRSLIPFLDELDLINYKHTKIDNDIWEPIFQKFLFVIIYSSYQIYKALITYLKKFILNYFL